MFTFDAERVAALEVAGWQAYYEHAWLKLLRLIVELCQTQFHIPFPLSLVAAYHITRASVDWVPVDHDLEAVRRSLERFYRLARRWSGLRFDPARASELELVYWVEHRRLSGRPDSEKEPFVCAMAALHAELFSLPTERARASAERRVGANNVLDTITSGASRNPAEDWRRCAELLGECYRSIQHEQHALA